MANRMHNEKMRRFMKERKSTQREAAEAIGITAGAFSLKSNGFTKDEVGKLALFYGVTVEEIEELLKRED